MLVPRPRYRTPAQFTDAQMDEFWDVCRVNDGQFWGGLPSYSLAQGLSRAQLVGLHDAYLRADLTTIATEEWLAAHPDAVGQFRRIELVYNVRRDLVTQARTMLTERDTDDRERRMEWLTAVATMSSVVAVIVATLALLAQLPA